MATRVINMTLPEELLREVDAAVKAEGRTRSDLLRDAIRRLLDERRSTRKDARPLLSRLAALAVKGPNLASEGIDRRLYAGRSKG